MRRKDRRVSDPADIEAVLSLCLVCRLAMTDDEGVYVVPMNFAYRYGEGVLSLLFHSAAEGRKIRALRKTGRASFETDVMFGASSAGDEGEACKWTAEYASAIGSGTVRFIEDAVEKREALALLARRFTDAEPALDEGAVRGCAVFELIADSFDVKANAPRARLERRAL